MKSKDLYLASKPHYAILDGLRGVAALVVVCFHLLEASSVDVMLTRYIGHGYLAVDFFFLLSGFVISYAYDDRWQDMTTWGFFKRRLVRLHPMIVVAAVLGVIFFYYGAGPVFPLVSQTSFGPLMLVFLMMLFMVPVPVGMDIKGWQETTPLNGNAWSLMFEYVANVLYALLLRRFPVWLLGGSALVCSLFTLDVALDFDLFGFLSERQAHYTLHGGWSLTVEQVYVGLSRLLYPFVIGLLLSKIVRREATSTPGRGGFWLTSLLLAAVLFTPSIGVDEPTLPNGFFEAMAVLLIFPFIVWLASGRGATGRTASICRFLGDISYPLYLVHQPIVFTLYGTWRATHLEATPVQLVVMTVSMLLLSLFLSYAILRLIDLPARQWLTLKLFRSAK